MTSVFFLVSVMSSTAASAFTKEERTHAAKNEENKVERAQRWEPEFELGELTQDPRELTYLAGDETEYRSFGFSVASQGKLSLEVHPGEQFSDIEVRITRLAEIFTHLHAREEFNPHGSAGQWWMVPKGRYFVSVRTTKRSGKGDGSMKVLASFERSEKTETSQENSSDGPLDELGDVTSSTVTASGFVGLGDVIDEYTFSARERGYVWLKANTLGSPVRVDVERFLESGFTEETVSVETSENNPAEIGFFTEANEIYKIQTTSKSDSLQNSAVPETERWLTEEDDTRGSVYNLEMSYLQKG